MYDQAHFKQTDPEIYSSIIKELNRQFSHIELIASENYTSRSVMEAQGSILTNKYAEGYPKKRYYGGCFAVDEVEILAIERLKELYGAEHANVQAHSGSNANQAAIMSCLSPGDTLLGMSLEAGGHLTHGYKVNFSGKIFNAISYGLNPKTGLIDYEQVESLALKYRPKMIICGASAYSRIIDWTHFREIADKVGAYLLADMAHYAGLIAAKIYPSPVGIADLITSTTHKTLRGPRGGIILSTQELAKKVDSAIFPGIQGGPLMHVIAAKAIAFQEALAPTFHTYQTQVLQNSRHFCKHLQNKGFQIMNGGTDCHMFSIDLRGDYPWSHLTGRDAQVILDSVFITLNKNMVLNDTRNPAQTSGIRLGTAAMTTRGLGVKEFEKIAELIIKTLSFSEKTEILDEVRQEVEILCQAFPLYS